MELMQSQPQLTLQWHVNARKLLKQVFVYIVRPRLLQGRFKVILYCIWQYNLNNIV